MKIKILDLAEKDLIEGFRFYEAQQDGLGTYFLNSLYADIESLRSYAGIHQTFVLPIAFAQISVRDLLQARRDYRINSCGSGLSEKSRLGS